MISNLTILGYRAFRELRVEPLTRVNLFVGPNNAGKTTVLEAVEILTRANVEALHGILKRRDEQLLKERALEPDPAHLFHGHSLKVGAGFSISGSQLVFHCALEKGRLREGMTDLPVLGLALTAGDAKAFHMLSPAGGLEIDPYKLDLAQRSSNGAAPAPDAVNFLGAEPFDAYRLGHLWDRLLLTPEEENVSSSLRIVEPRLDRVAFLGENLPSLRTIFVRLSGENRVPLGSMGDGVKRLLSLVLHLLTAKGGYLLVDEIDTGLHHSVMADMWELVIQAAERLDIQVFATTHSLDCVRSLARVRDRNPEIAHDVTVHRLRKDMTTTVTYDMDEIAIAARDRIEIR